MSEAKSSRQLLFVLAIGLLAAVGFAAWFRFAILARTQGLQAGRALPPIRAAGWLNGPPPSEEELRGKVMVLDAWATWCGVCRRVAEEHVELHEAYRDRGVVFLGLTDEGEELLPEIEQFIADTGMTWPNGYGAVETLQDLGVSDVRPGVWVVGRDGRILWRYGSSEPLEEAIERALAAAQ